MLFVEKNAHHQSLDTLTVRYRGIGFGAEVIDELSDLKSIQEMSDDEKRSKSMGF